MARLRRPFSLVTRSVPQMSIRPENTVLLVQDMQRFLADRSCGIGAAAEHRGVATEFDDYYRAVDLIRETIPRLRSALEGFGIAVWYTRWTAARPPEINRVQQALGIVPAADDAESEIIGAVRPGDDGAVFFKSGLGALSSTALAGALEARRVENIVLAGVTTEYGIQATVFQAMDMGYRLLIVADCCAAMTQSAHETALDGLSFGMVKIRPLEELRYNLSSLEHDDVAVL